MLYNVPGGIYTPGDISSDTFNKLLAYEDFTEPTYGSQSKSYPLQDGTMTYHMKENAEASGKVKFSIGLYVKDEVFNGDDILKAVSVAVGTYTNDSFTASNDGTKAFDLKMDEKAPFNSVMSGIANAEIDKPASAIQFLYLNNSRGNSTEILFDKAEFDIAYPIGCELKMWDSIR